MDPSRVLNEAVRVAITLEPLAFAAGATGDGAPEAGSLDLRVGITQPFELEQEGVVRLGTEAGRSVVRRQSSSASR
ncbi:MAG: hypothetical protein AAF791_15895 [Bacteroidota bacterium]